MKKRTRNNIIAVLIAAIALSAFIAITVKAEDPSPIAPAPAAPVVEDSTEPAVQETTEPTDVTADDVIDVVEPTEPEVTEPEATEPEVTEPTVKPVEPTKKPEETTTPNTKPIESVKPTEPETEVVEPEVKPETDPKFELETPVEHVHNYVCINTVNATCISAGYSTYKCECGEMYNGNETDLIPHTYVSEVIAPTYDAEGYTQHYCTGCGDFYKDSYVDRMDEEPVVEETQPETSEPSNPTEHVCSGGCHEEIVSGGYTYVYCEDVEEPYLSEDGFTVYYPYEFYF